MDDLEKFDEKPDTNLEEGDPGEPILAGEEIVQFSEDKGHPIIITILVGVAMLLAGVLFGYVGRGQFGPEAQAAKSTSTAQAVAAATQTAVYIEASATQAAANAELMKIMSENTRHYKGDPNAPVTIIEFSDFQ